MTVFHLVRHGAYGLLDKALGGRSSHSLDAEGHAQAERVADALHEVDIAAIASSPMERAKQTAQPLASRCGLAVEIAAEFAEIDFGPWTGADFDSLHNARGWHAWNAFRSTAPIPGGECMLAVQARAMAGIMRLESAWSGRDIVVVSHGDIIKAVLAHLLGMPLDLLRRIEIFPASISSFSLQEVDARILGVNRRV